MRRQLLVTSLWIFLAACAERQKPEIVQAETIYAIDEEAFFESNTYFDTLDTDATRIAWGDFLFGMTQNEFYDVKTRNRNYFYHIGGKEYSLTGMFDDSGKLYMLHMESIAREKQLLDSKIRDEYITLYKMASEHFGSTTEEYGFPANDELAPGEVKWLKLWKLQNRLVRLGIQHHVTSDYCAVLQIADQPVLEKMKAL